VIDGTAVNAIAELAKRATGVDGARTVDIDGTQFYVGDLKQLPAPTAPEPTPLNVHTLTGLVDYIRTNRDRLELSEYFVHVVGPGVVQLRSNLQGDALQRFTLVTAVLLQRGNFKFGEFYKQEDFIIALQTSFEDTLERRELLRIVGTMQFEDVRTQSDDGATQRVTARSGVALVDTVSVPNPVLLKPFRTFAEVGQPSSEFVVRVRKDADMKVALFEADGGAWKNDAIRAVAEFVRAQELDVPVLS
jgi:hypothetical protein